MKSVTLSIAAVALAPFSTAQHLEKKDNTPGALPQLFDRPAMASSVTVRRGPFVSTQVNLNRAGNNVPRDAANEPSITFDPRDPDKLAIGWRQFDTISNNFRQNGRAWSTDGGASWTSPGPITPGQFYSDPVLDSDRNGNLHYLAYPGGRTLAVFSSTDGGQTFGPGRNITGGDKAWMIVDRTGGVGDGNVYIIWQVVHGPNTFIRSLNRGASWTGTSPVPSTPTFGTMAIAPNGDVCVAGLIRQNFGSFIFARSANAKSNVASPSWQSTGVNMGGSMDIRGTPNPGGLMGQCNVATDPSRPNNVYLLCSVDPPGSDPMDVHFVRSTDGGRTFSAPVRVNDSRSGWQWMSAMSVSPDGRIDAVWADTRNGQDTESEVFWAYSLDEGRTWTRNVAIGPQWNSVVGHPNQAKIGDYYDMKSTTAETHVAYATTYSGEQDVWYIGLGDCNDNGVHDSTEIANGSSFDANGNLVPDECETCQTDLGSGNGMRMLVCGDDLTQPGSRATLQIDGGLPSRPTFILISTARLANPIPLGNGAFLIPDPTIGFGVDTLSTNATGALGATIQGGAGGPTKVYAQAAQLDAQANLSVSNAVEIDLGF